MIRYVEEYQVEALLGGSSPATSKVTRDIDEARRMRDDAEDYGAGWARIIVRTVREEKRLWQRTWRLTGVTRWTENSGSFEFI